jgi:hypothetical protein
MSKKIDEKSDKFITVQNVSEYCNNYFCRICNKQIAIKHDITLHIYTEHKEYIEEFKSSDFYIKYNTVKFAKNFNKLNCPEGALFGTVRNHSDEKEHYYKTAIGEIFQVEVNGDFKFHARLLDVIISTERNNKIFNDFLLYDTDNDSAWIDKIRQLKHSLILIFIKGV